MTKAEAAVIAAARAVTEACTGWDVYEEDMPGCLVGLLQALDCAIVELDEETDTP